MSALSLRLLDSIHRYIKEIAKREGVFINQFISSAVSEKISAIMTDELLTQRAKRAKKDAFKKVLDRVPNRPPIPGDELREEIKVSGTLPRLAYRPVPGQPQEGSPLFHSTILLKPALRGDNMNVFSPSVSHP